MITEPTLSEPPCAFEVIGEHLGDPTRLLVLGDNGQYYALDLVDGRTIPTDLSDGWVVDTCDRSDTLRRMRPN